MLEWPRYSIYDSPKYLELRNKIKNPGPGRPKAWAYPWCILNGELEGKLISLDFGCGSWTNFPYYISGITNFLTVGVDIGNLQQNSDIVRFHKTPLDKLEFPDNFFDRIFSISVLEHVPIASRDKVLTELFRVLRPGGLAVLTIDWIFGMNDRLLEQLKTSQDLGRIGSQIYGNFDFAKIIFDYRHMVTPLSPIDEQLLPGSTAFDEDRLLDDKDILVSQSNQIKDVELFRYTTVGMILKKEGGQVK
jgi:SAM-dependent methyltransferase